MMRLVSPASPVEVRGRKLQPERRNPEEVRRAKEDRDVGGRGRVRGERPKCTRTYTHTHAQYYEVGERKKEREEKKGKIEEEERLPPKHLASILLLVAPLRRNSFLFLQDHEIHGNRLRSTPLTQSAVRILPSSHLLFFLQTRRYIDRRTFHKICLTEKSRGTVSRGPHASRDDHIFLRRILCGTRPSEKSHRSEGYSKRYVPIHHCSSEASSRGRSISITI